MALKVGSSDVAGVYVGSNMVKGVYVGSTKVWAPAAYDNCVGATGLGSGTSFSFTAAAGADVFAVLTYDRTASPGTPTYNGSAMSHYMTLYHNNTASTGGLVIWRAAKAGTGSAATVASPSAGSAWWSFAAISFRDVHTLHTPQTAYNYTQNPSVSWTLAPGQVALFALGGGNGGGSMGSYSSISGVTTRYTAGNAGSSIVVAAPEASGSMSCSGPFQHRWANIVIPMS
ncbi:minor tail protein [Mycobacterium phage Firecracker]|uniref:Minor tail protein n=1 Tax=Mycobacterium phage Firecracker TaxID=2922998 RepID=G8I447_9CAUD|nr:minor tail protein [Mycobacterium phage Firecracker]AER47491.1 hypothetical protein FIRECRACKER_65 [Mycobacterium phage Firecracker]